ncbi:MAG TPA: 3-phosphoshikimate 1-carboxyvinyltransferase [Fimbriimonas sp.]|nr:3-phosphoshikimate 1-carboxyvinyltransferase [Fimbriimonas sp.]
MRLVSRRVATIQGSLRAPSHKSLTHRAYMFAALASGPCRVSNPLRGEDCESTLRCMNQLGLRHDWIGDTQIVLEPIARWKEPDGPLDCGNSGTTMRLLSGLVASRPMTATMIGDASLSKRPMRRVAEPLRRMGAEVEGDYPPLFIKGSNSLKGIVHKSPVASGQIKSCVLLAGLRASGETVVQEPSLSRDHTERMLQAMGAPVSTKIDLGTGAAEVTISAAENLKPFELTVPADISSAAFFMVAAALLPEARLTLEELSLNPSRTGILDVFERCGIEVHHGNVRDELGEPVADLEMRAPKFLKPFDIDGGLVTRLIDEIPVLAVLATQCEGETRIRNARELRVKESDRIELMADGLRRMGAQVETQEDGMTIVGPTPLTGTHVKAEGDHRIAMSFAIAGLIADGETVIDGAETIATSFPGFEEELERLSIV